MEQTNTQDYIGDGVYVEFDGFSIWLKANHHEHPTDKVCLEPLVFGGLLRFAERVGYNLDELKKS